MAETIPAHPTPTETDRHIGITLISNGRF